MVLLLWMVWLFDSVALLCFGLVFDCVGCLFGVWWFSGGCGGFGGLGCSFWLGCGF